MDIRMHFPLRVLRYFAGCFAHAEDLWSLISRDHFREECVELPVDKRDGKKEDRENHTSLLRWGASSDQYAGRSWEELSAHQQWWRRGKPPVERQKFARQSASQ
jgi:hypothetical protein